ncbi:MAG: GFA family protein [Rhodospirillales bacterium]|nr:GFA family protein [Rhodospirillales bacterium]
MKYTGNCLCGNVTFQFPYDPMMQFQCHCTVCQKVFGTSLNAIALPEDELSHEGELDVFSISGGSGKKLHYYFCPQCSIIVYNKPDVLDGMIYLPAGLLADQIEFSPTVELWTKSKAKWLPQAGSIKASFEDNGTVERLVELLENLDQRET